MTTELEDRDQFLLKTIKEIDKFGFIGMTIFGPEPVDNFVYTAGLTAKEAPELIIVGLNHTQANPIICALGEEVLKGFVVQDGQLLDWLLLGAYDIKVRGPIDVVDGELNIARSIYPVVQGYQLLFPDEAGRFPDDPECDPEVVAHQRLIPYEEGHG